MISNIIGIDSEAYTTGTPFMLCTSIHDVIDPHEVPQCFFNYLTNYHNYISTNFVVWNLKYDSGAILYYLPRESMEKLWLNGKVTVVLNDQVFRFQYIPHKLLRIYHKKKLVSFWDISQFFKSSLDNAAKKYLGEAKLHMPTKSFTPEYVTSHYDKLVSYCIRDAELTARLGQYAIDKFEQFGITTPSLYSCASISMKYFADHTKLVDVWRFWKHHQRLIAHATDAYEGGKFEVTTRGAFTGYEYDISSAYPYEISNLLDLTNSEVEYSSTYRPDATYGFLRCLIDNSTAKHLPCGPMLNGIRVYPTGKFYLAITKQEYEYLISIDIKIEIISAAWIFITRKVYPYRKIISNLFSIKAHHKHNDPMMYSNAKIVMNSFYGKLAQSVAAPDGKVHLGSAWNPIHASVVTANTRLKVTKIQNTLKSKCLAVHTDSVIVTEKLPESIQLDGLGNFEYVTQGEGVIVACGMYQIGEECAFKGFRPKKKETKGPEKETWKTLLHKHGNRKTIPYKILHVESWIEAMAKNHLNERINLFLKAKKEMNLNCDTKRAWPRDLTAIEFLNITQESMPKIQIETDPPKFW